MSSTWTFSPTITLKDSASIDIYPGYGESLRLQMLREFAGEYRQHRSADIKYEMILEGFFHDIGDWSLKRVSLRRDTIYDDLVNRVNLDRGSIFRAMTTSPNLAGIVRVRFRRNTSAWFYSESGENGPVLKSMQHGKTSAHDVEPEGSITMDAKEGTVSTEVEITPLGNGKQSPFKLSLTVTVGKDGLEAVESSLKLFKMELRKKSLLWGTVNNVNLSIKLNSEIKFASHEDGRLELEKFKTKLKAAISAEITIGVVSFPIEAFAYVDQLGDRKWGIAATVFRFP